jgi:putative FmdB family regulatory protein
MPIYEYQCANCGHQLEELQSFSEPPLTKCPQCGKDTLKKLIGGGAGLIFKGSGFYLTDYKKASSSGSAQTKKQKPAEPKSAESKSHASGKTSKESKKKT